MSRFTRVARSFVVVAILGAALLAAACAVAPYSGTVISRNTVDFDGLVDTPNATIRLKAWDYGIGSFVPLAQVTAGSTPYFQAGAICPNSPPLYRYAGTIHLVWPIYWRLNAAGRYQTKVTATHVGAGEVPLFFADNADATSCMASNAFNSTCDFYNVAVACGYRLNEAVVETTSLAPWR